MSGNTHAVNVGIENETQNADAERLGFVLADTYTLYLKTHNYHWNVTGPQFTTLHNLFEEQYTSMWQAVDALAERIRMLGAPAPGSYSAFACLTEIEEDPEGTVPDATTMIRNLATDHETVARRIRPALQAAAEAGDDVTADLLTQRLADHEQTAWMLRSHLA